MKRSSSYYYRIGFYVLIALVLLDAYSLIGYFSRGERVRSVLTRHLGSTFTFDRHRFRIFQGLTLTNFRLYSSPSKEPQTLLFQTERARIRFNLFHLLEGKTTPSEITIRNPEVTLKQNDKGELNLQKFIEQIPPIKTDEGTGLKTNISVVDGTLHLQNMPFLLAPGKEIRPMDVNLDIRPIRDGSGFILDGAGRDRSLGLVSVQGRYRDQHLRLNITCDHFEVGSELVNTFARDLREKWQKYQLAGPATLSYQLDYDASEANGTNPLSQKLTVSAHGMRASFADFPYTVTDLYGRIMFQPERIEFGLRSENNDQFIRVNGSVEGYEDTSALNVAIHAEQLPIDQKLYAALEPDIRTFIKSLNLSGTANANGYISRPAGKEEVDYTIRIHPKEVSGRFDEFPYPVKNLSGTVIVKPNRIRLEQLTGIPNLEKAPENASISLNGSLSLKEDSDDELEESTSSSDTSKKAFHPAYHLEIQGTEIPFDPTLKSMLPPVVRNVWNQLHPDGTGSVDWKLTRSEQQEDVQHDLHVTLKNCLLHPERFQNAIQNIQANIKFSGGDISLSEVSGNWNEGTLNIHQGRIHLDPSSESFGTFQISGVNLRVTPPLQELVFQDPDLVSAVKNRGKVDFRGQINWSRNQEDNDLEYQVVANVDGMQIERVLTFSEIRGKVTLKGDVVRQGDQAHNVLSGGINLDHLMVEQVPLRTFQANFLTDEGKVLINDFRGQLTGGSIKEGSLTYLTDQKTFNGKLEARDLKLQELLSQLGMDEKNLSGHLSGSLQLSGKTSDRSSWSGSGKLELRNALLWKLPVFLSVFNNLSLSRQTPFTTGEVKYRIQNEQVQIRRMKFESDTARLLARGRVGFDGNLKLNLQTENTNSPTIPVVGWFYNQITKNLVTLQATGTLQNPSVSVTPLPFLFKENLND